MEAHLEVYAAAARAFEAEEGRWPEDRGELLSMLDRTPSGGPATARIEAVGEVDGTFRMPFLVQRGPQPSNDRPTLLGVVEVAPESAADEPAARIQWEFRDGVAGRSGTITMQECALGEYGRQE